MLQTIGEICGFIGGSIGTVPGIPQMLRIRRMGHSDGVALSPWVLMVIQFGAWSGFGFKTGSPSIIFANIFTFVTSALVVTAMKGNSFKVWLLLILGGFAAGWYVFAGPSAITDWVLILLTGSRFPQLVVTWFNRARAKPTAVSISSLMVAFMSMCFWMAFAILTENHLVVTTTIVAMSVTILTAVIEGRIVAKAKVVI